MHVESSTDIHGPIWEAVPKDHARQTSAEEVARGVLDQHRIRSLVDLGCGDGSAYDWVRKRSPRVDYVGVDIEWSPQVSTTFAPST